MIVATTKKRVALGAWAGSAAAAPVTVTGVTSAGTTSQANSTAIGVDTEYTRVDTAAANGGVRLPVPTGPQDTRVVTHAGATNAVLLFPATGGKINGLAANASLSIPVGKAALCVAINATDWAVFLSA